MDLRKRARNGRWGRSRLGRRKRTRYGVLSDDDIKARNANKPSKVQWTTDTDE